jgi:hypothetical protein
MGIKKMREINQKYSKRKIKNNKLRKLTKSNENTTHHFFMQN